MRLRTAALALLSSALFVVSFPNLLVPAFPALAGAIAWAALSPLLLALGAVSRLREACLAGFLFGAVAFLLGLYWVPHSMVHFGGIAKPAAYGILALLALYLALYPALFAVLLVRAAPRAPLARALFSATAWTALEWARSHVLTGFPWLSLGYSQWRNLPLLTFSAVGSVYLLSFLVVLVSSALAGAWAWRSRGTPAPAWRASPPAALGAAVLAAALAHAAGSLASPRGAGEAVPVAVVQPNVPQDQKWDPGAAERILARLLGLSERAVAYGARLVVWPEASFPFLLQNEPERAEAVYRFVRRTGTPLLLGSGEMEDERYYNAVYLVTRDRPSRPATAVAGVFVQRYRKVHLLPFGEYIPWWAAMFLPGAQQIAHSAGAGGLSPGAGYPVLDAGAFQVGVLVCYESVFPAECARFTRARADLLVNVTNDAWFGSTAGPYQHASMLALRAAENRVPLARAANTGISGFFEPSGRLRQATALEMEDVRVEAVQKGPGPLAWTRSGDAVGTLCALACAAWLVLLRVRRRG